MLLVLRISCWQLKKDAATQKDTGAGALTPPSPTRSNPPWPYKSGADARGGGGGVGARGFLALRVAGDGP